MVLAISSVIGLGNIVGELLSIYKIQSMARASSETYIINGVWVFPLSGIVPAPSVCSGVRFESS